ncbi:Cu(I)-responsive transcriptional regulator [bacterium]|jgi:MerR family transcriptional regulator, copper efflux regulator|nr:Cu(I)-responsive transcriptional regulator [Gammaproteobacteria bacterium]MDB3937052.1 Cu(I)-responsive transcriptional regulator [bacterium]MDC0559240.1 Cu(I)-responsive transcriptional regulator [bacterium]
MNIGDVAKRTGLPAKTIRYYEEIELLHPARHANGYRYFSEADVHKLRFLGRSRSLGFTIEECRALLGLYSDPGRASADVKAIALDHLSQIDQKLLKLLEMQQTLRQLVDRCHGDDRPDCPILTDLAGKEKAPRSP